MNTRSSIQKIAGTLGGDPVTMLTCTVEGVSIPDRTCTVTPVNGLFTSFPAFLMAEIDDGVLIVPSTGSTVKVIYSNRNAPTVVQYSQIDQVLIIAGDQKYSITNGLQQFNDGTYGGLMQIAPSITSWNNLEDDINNLKSDLNSLVTAANALLSALPTSGPAPASAVSAFATAVVSSFTSYVSATLTRTDRANIENTNIKHGKQM